MAPGCDASAPGSGRDLLVVDDDTTFCTALAAAFERRGFHVRVAHDAASGLGLAEQRPPTHALVDLRMPGPSGLELVAGLHALDLSMRIVVLTGFASIATAVEAIKLGATHYLSKPADADEIAAAFGRQAGDPEARLAHRPLPVDRLEWEHIQRILNECHGNVSETARRLGMHRRTLQRKLRRVPPEEPG